LAGARIAASAHRIRGSDEGREIELTFSTPTLKMAVRAAKRAESTAHSCQDKSADFIDDPHVVMVEGGGGPSYRSSPSRTFDQIFRSKRSQDIQIACAPRGATVPVALWRQAIDTNSLLQHGMALLILGSIPALIPRSEDAGSLLAGQV
jgi:hypothetical protein